MPEKEPYKGVAFKTVSAVTNEVSNFHNKSDVDSGSLAQHHTLGGGVNQAAPGNHGNVLGDLKQSFQTENHRNWLRLNGQAVSRTTWSKLFAMWGTTYGAGDGSTTFNLPNMAGRFPVGVSGTKPLGSTGGADTVTLVTGNLPAHTHAIDHDHGSVATSSDGSHDHGLDRGTGTGSSTLTIPRGVTTVDLTNNAAIAADGVHSHTVDLPNYVGASGSTGGGNAFDITPKYLAVNYFVWGS